MSTAKGLRSRRVIQRLIVNRYFHLNIDSKVGLIFTFYIVLFSLALSIVHYRGTQLGMGEPFNSFLMPGWFGDFSAVFDLWRGNHGLGGVDYGSLYFPGLYVFAEILFLITKDTRTAYVLFYVFYLSMVTGSVLLFLRTRGFVTSLMGLILIFISYPNLIALHTGNFEMVVFLLILLAALCAYAEKWNYFSVCIGIAAATKAFPGIFALAPFVLTSPKIAFRSLLLSVKTSILFTLFAVLFLPGGVYSDGFDSLQKIVNSTLKSQKMYSDLMVTGVPGLHFGHSVLNGIHSVFGMEFLPSENWAYPVMILGVIWTIAALLFIRKLNPPIWLTFGFLGCSGCMFAPTSTDYKLLYLLPAIILYFRDIDTKIESLMLMLVLVCAIVPKPYWYVGSDAWTNANVWLTPILLLTYQLVSITFMKRAVYREEVVSKS